MQIAPLDGSQSGRAGSAGAMIGIPGRMGGGARGDAPAGRAARQSMANGMRMPLNARAAPRFPGNATARSGQTFFDAFSSHLPDSSDQ